MGSSIWALGMKAQKMVRQVGSQILSWLGFPRRLWFSNTYMQVQRMVWEQSLKLEFACEQLWFLRLACTLNESSGLEYLNFGYKLEGVGLVHNWGALQVHPTNVWRERTSLIRTLLKYHECLCSLSNTLCVISTNVVDKQYYSSKYSRKQSSRQNRLRCEECNC